MGLKLGVETKMVFGGCGVGCGGMGVEGMIRLQLLKEKQIRRRTQSRHEGFSDNDKGGPEAIRVNSEGKSP